MESKTGKNNHGMFDRSAAITNAAGNPVVFYLAVAVMLIWSACGTIFNYSNT